eukprot:g1598.t1
MDRIQPVLKKHSYIPLKKVGSGSFGQAWLVGHDEDGKRQNYVCKMIDISRCSQKEKKDALHEASVLKTLQHPYVVRYKESFLEDGWLCIVQEYCEGGDMYQRIQKAKKQHQPFSESQIVTWFTQCMMGLKFIHEKKILHRDLKSSNFFLSKSGDIKMGDFGIAKVLESTAAVAKTQIGTPYYLSPEICQEKAYAWPSDIWAMGCILYELCCLRVPFDAADLRALDILVKDHNRRPTASVILTRQILADRVRKFDADRAASENSSGAGGPEKVSKEGEAGSGGGGDPAKQKDDISTIAEKLNQQQKDVKSNKPKGQYADDAGKYVKNQVVEYYSETHKEWLPAQVTAVDAEGRIQVHCKPNAWLSLNVQAQKVRPKKDENKENKPRPPLVPDHGLIRKEQPPAIGGGLAGGGGSRASSFTPRGHLHGAATPPVYHRQATPPYPGYPPAGGRVGSPSPFSRGTPRLAYGVNRYTPRGGQIGTPRAASPMNRPAWQNHSPRGGYSNRIY